MLQSVEMSLGWFTWTRSGSIFPLATLEGATLSSVLGSAGEVSKNSFVGAGKGSFGASDGCICDSAGSVSAVEGSFRGTERSLGGSDGLFNGFGASQGAPVSATGSKAQ